MAINGYDIIYAIGVGISAPVWAVRSKSRKKVLKALKERMGHVPIRAGNDLAVMIHAVSVGEMNAARHLIDQLQSRLPNVHIILSTTTQTGYERAQQLYANRNDVTTIQYPLDFTYAIHRVLDNLRPHLVILMELEVWPNFVSCCVKRNIPVTIANGRITLPSFNGYKRVGFVTRKMFAKLSQVCVQEDLYAERFNKLGVPSDKIIVTGTMKFDTASTDINVPGATELARQVGLQTGARPLWVCGSTGPGEEEIILRIYAQLLTLFPMLQLAIIPRKPERFEEVAQFIRQTQFTFVRRSQTTSVTESPQIILGDTMGELRKFYALADVVFVGRTLCDLGAKQHGSDMIEPAALGKPTLVGPYTHNFSDVMNAFRSTHAMIEILTENDLLEQTRIILLDRNQATQLGNKSREIVLQSRGATDRTLDTIQRYLTTNAPNIKK